MILSDNPQDYEGILFSTNSKSYNYLISFFIDKKDSFEILCFDEKIVSLKILKKDSVFSYYHLCNAIHNISFDDIKNSINNSSWRIEGKKELI